MKDIRLEIETIWIAIAIIVTACLVTSEGIRITITHENKGVVEAKTQVQASKLYTEPR